MLHQLICVIECVERVRGKAERFREQADEAIAELLHVSKVGFHDVFESWYKLFIGPLEPNIVNRYGRPDDRADHVPGKVPRVVGIPERRVSTESHEGWQNQTVPDSLPCLS